MSDKTNLDYQSDSSIEESSVHQSPMVDPSLMMSADHKKRVGGRQAGATNYSKEEVALLLQIIERVRPSHPHHWEKVSEEYNLENVNKRTGENLHKKFVGLVKKKSGGASSMEMDKAKQLYMILKSNNAGEPLDMPMMYPPARERVMETETPASAVMSGLHLLSEKIDKSVQSKDLAQLMNILQSISSDVKQILHKVAEQELELKRMAQDQFNDQPHKVSRKEN